MTRSDPKRDWLEAASPGESAPAPIQKLSGRLPGASFAESLRELGRDPTDVAALEIGDRIRQARQARGLTQAELAGLIGRKQNDLSDIERGKGKDGPTYRTLQAIAEALKIDLSISPRALAADEVVITTSHAEGDGTILANTSTCEAYRPLFSDMEWGQVRRFVAGKVQTHAAPEPGYRSCTVLTVPAATKATLSPIMKDAVVTTVRGDATWTFHGIRDRRGRLEDGRVVAVFKEDGRVDVATGDQPVSIVFMPAAAILADDADGACWSR